MEIILGGKNAEKMLVSESDFEELSKYKFYNSGGYARGLIDGVSVGVHTYIVKSNYSDGDIVDHINGNRLDNRRENLKITTAQKNSENKNISKSKISSKYLGITYHKGNKKYQVRFNLSGKAIQLGHFKDEITAAEIRDAYMIQNNIDHVKLNFPEKKEIYLKMETVIPTTRTNQYTGIYRRKNIYEASITINKKLIHIGRDDKASECAKLYDKYIVENNIPAKKLNFPENYPDYNPNSIIKTLCTKIDDKTVELNDKIVIDKVDYDKVKNYPISINEYGYAKITVNNKNMRLHRYLLDATDPLIFVDHIDHNKLNNSRSNLRLSNAKLNSQNKTKRVGSSSNYYGVAKHQDGTYRSYISKDNVRIYICNRKDEITSARLRDIYVLTHFKDDHYTLNFKWDDDDELKEWQNKFKINTDTMDNIREKRKKSN